MLRANATDSTYCAGRVEVPPTQLLVLRQGKEHEMKTRTVCVVGGRNYYERVTMWRVLAEENWVAPIGKIIHGGGGTGRSVQNWIARHNAKMESRQCERRIIDQEVFEPDWSAGRQAAYARSAEMLATMPDLVIAFPRAQGYRL